MNKTLFFIREDLPLDSLGRGFGQEFVVGWCLLDVPEAFDFLDFLILGFSHFEPEKHDVEKHEHEKDQEDITTHDRIESREEQREKNVSQIIGD